MQDMVGCRIVVDGNLEEEWDCAPLVDCFPDMDVRLENID